MTDSKEGREDGRERRREQSRRETGRKEEGRKERMEGGILAVVSPKVPDSFQVLFVSTLPSLAPRMVCPTFGFCLFVLYKSANKQSLAISCL